MQVVKVSNRGVMFCFRPLNRWPLNCFLICAESANYLIDTACGSGDAEQIADYICKNCPRKPLVIVNTHHHWDHIWGNGYFADAPIIANAECAKLTKEYWDVMLAENAEYVVGDALCKLPTVEISEPTTYEQDGILLFPSVGHTADGLCVLDLRDKVLYAGDNVGDTVDEPLPWLTCDKQDYVQAIRYMKSLPFNVLCSGHNVVLDKSFLDKISFALSQGN